MDRISDSDSEDAGSIPAGATNKADPEATSIRLHEVCFRVALLCPEAVDEGDLLQENRISFEQSLTYYCS